jgi:predicted transcriptional regulator
MSTGTICERAKKVIDDLPANSTWDHVIEALYVRQTIEAGLADLDAGRVETSEELCERLGIVL